MKLKFWHKDDLGDDLGLPQGTPPPGAPAIPQGRDELALNMPRQDPPVDSFAGLRAVPAQEPRMQSSYGGGRDLELVLAKLDALKATLDSINQRVANLERVAYGEDEPTQRRGW